MPLTQQFDAAAAQYLQFRPTYPAALFQWLADITPQHRLAIDCGTGNGQAAVAIAPYFDQTIAIDRHNNPLKHALPHPSVEYRHLPAEHMDFADQSVDLIVAASAAHWFDLAAFYPQCQRVLSSDGRIVLWSYSWPNAQDRAIRAILSEAKQALDPHWSAPSLWHLNAYRDLPFPFETVPTPHFQLTLDWDIDQLIQFLFTWAAIREHVQQRDAHFLDRLRGQLERIWPATQPRHFIFPIHMKAGRLG